ncbi:uncharacterized protein LOC121374520 [Gigantopelta aegis]|uniref:uncharacterized protein LOC121374520 n=1 Tax=Gigantopelta aegis TaxID=1735272 RepID=UPI001B888C4F|nr:uncharacterized protein LOC121374520 [Gigantopelta aegis]
MIYYSIIVYFFILQTKPAFGAFENVAVGKTADQSSYLSNWIKNATNAVDGSIATCIHTDVGKDNSWWEVDMGKEYFIHQVGIYFRTGWKWRRNGIQVYTSMSPRQTVTGQPCGEQITGNMDGSDIADVTTRTCDVTGRYVTLYTNTLNKDSCNACDGGKAMDFCEVFVMACELNVKYGPNCNKMCNDRKCATKTSSCDMIGTCIGGCQAGWKNTDCTEEQN